jgi:hypothetical protein
MAAKNLIKRIAVAAALVASGVAGATVTDLTGQYGLVATSSAVAGHVNEYTFSYSVTNIAQGYAGSNTGLDGFTIYIPTTANIVSSSTPVSYAGSPGYWTKGTSPALDLSYGGSTSQNMVAPAGYTAFTWWGQNTESVYQIGSTANFSITLSNVAIGHNAVGISTYFGNAAANNGQQFVNNPYGNYTTFSASALSAVSVAAVPEPETYAMMLAGLGMVGLLGRRRRRG